MYLMNFYVFFHLGASSYNFHINDCRDPISTLNFHFAHRPLQRESKQNTHLADNSDY